MTLKIKIMVTSRPLRNFLLEQVKEAAWSIKASMFRAQEIIRKPSIIKAVRQSLASDQAEEHR